MTSVCYFPNCYQIISIVLSYLSIARVLVEYTRTNFQNREYEPCYISSYEEKKIEPENNMAINYAF
jgi:hypothetical protein